MLQNLKHKRKHFEKLNKPVLVGKFYGTIRLEIRTYIFFCLSLSVAFHVFRGQ